VIPMTRLRPLSMTTHTIIFALYSLKWDAVRCEVSFMSFRIKNRLPANPDDFERLCLRLLKAHWNCPTLELYGRRGERQHGIDIIDMSGEEPLRAAQCKLYDEGNTIPPADIEAEVEAATKFDVRVGIYAICTTARVSTQAQKAILSINQEHRKTGLFQVELFTWDRLDELLEEFPSIRDDVYRTLGGETARQLRDDIADIRLSISGLATQVVSTGVESTDALHAEIDEARDLLRSGEPQTARLLLQRLRTRKWDRMEPRHRYRVLSNIGAAYLAERNFSQATQFFIDAVAFQPDDSQAAENEALAYYISKPPDEAFAAITRVREKFPHAPRVNAYWITVTPPAVTRIQIEQELNAADLSTPEVIAALASRALAECEFDVAEQLATRAVEERPEWSFPRYLKARAFVLRVMGSSRSLTLSAQLKQFRSVLQPLTTALEAAVKEHDLTMQTLCLLERFQMHLLLKGFSEAEADLLSAQRISPDDIAVKRAAAELSFRKNETDKAISELRTIDSQDRPDVALLLAESLRKRGKPSDLPEAIEILKRVADSSGRAIPEGREYVGSILLSLLSQAKRWQEYEQACDTFLARGVSQALVSAFRAKGAFMQDLLDDANRLAGESVASLSEKAPPGEVQWVAATLSELGRFIEALPLWQRIASESELTEYTKGFLDCAMRLGRDDLILETCSALRNNGVVDSNLILYEVQTLEQYDVEAVITALKDYLSKCPDDRIARLRLSFIGTNRKRGDVVDANPAVMPSVTDVSIENGRAAIQVMKFGGFPNEALSYGYELLRLHFDDPDAHRGYTFNLLPFEPQADIPACFPEAKIGCAVCYVEDNETQESWMIIEDSPNPEMSRQEYSPEHSLSQAMMGKKVGDRVVLAKGSVSERAATIKTISSKYVYRYQDSMKNLQIRFPDVKGLESVKVVRTNKDGKEEADFSAVIASVEQLAANTQRLKEVYATQPITIHMLADARGKSIIETTFYLAQQDDVGIFCCAGNAEERDKALAALDVSGTWIIEPTALATIFLLDLEDDLARLPVNLVLSQGTVADFEEVIRDDSLYRGDGGVLTKLGSRVAFVPQSSSEREARLRAFTERMNKVKAAVRVLGCVELAKLDKQRRELTIKAFGEGGAESIVLAAKPGHLLWTDDSRLAGYGTTEHGLKSAWTQAILLWAAQRGHISENQFVRYTAKLIGYGYTFTSPSLPALIAAAEIAEWDKSRRPLSQALAQLGTESIQLRDAAQLAVYFLPHVYRQNILDERRRAITLELLDQIGSRTGGVQAIQAIRRAVPQVFGLDVIGAEAATSTIAGWLNSRTIQEVIKV
jgi:tetratricopeptide (TPR) repeat protein/predicted nucleic acid-binding protein